MSSPHIDSTCLDCVDLRASLHRTDRELARVITERDRYHDVAQERAARATENLERARYSEARLGTVITIHRRILRALDLDYELMSPDDIISRIELLVAAERNSLMPGWTCHCGVWNGLAKAERMTCRACDALRPAMNEEAVR